MAPTIRTVLLDTLEDLTQGELRKFCTRLLDRRREGEPRIRRSALENQDRVGVVEVLVRTFTAAGAGRVVVETLRAIIRYDLAEELETRLETLRPATAQSTSQPTDACDLTLDPNTANRYLSVSENKKTVTWVNEDQSPPTHPDRFTGYHQVLCRETLTDRCYWEVEWRGDVGITVSYRGIPRSGGWKESGFASNNKSWSLDCSDDRYSAWYNGRKTAISLPPSGSHRVRVYVDRPAGTVSYYRVTPDVGGSDPLTLIHTYTPHTFSQDDLLAGFGLYTSGSSVSLIQSPAQV